MWILNLGTDDEMGKVYNMTDITSYFLLVRFCLIPKTYHITNHWYFTYCSYLLFFIYMNIVLTNRCKNGKIISLDGHNIILLICFIQHTVLFFPNITNHWYFICSYLLFFIYMNIGLTNRRKNEKSILCDTNNNRN